MRELFRRLFSKPALNEARSRGRPQDPGDFSWLFPPQTVTDPAAWDQYWKDQLSHGAAGFVHLFVDDGELVDAMRAHELRTILCVGNGISLEPHALASSGFDVTSLDISPLAAKVAGQATPPDDFLSKLVGGRPRDRKGHLDFVVGDLRDPSLCPGPFDVVIERKTLQLWPDGERSMAAQAVANRLASRGIFFSQSHDGGWRPPEPPRHALEPWFVAEKWESWRPGVPLTGRVAWLFTTTG
jgi:hypothetical protein